MFTGLFMDKMVGFVKNYFPVFLLGAIFGKVIELSGFSKAIVSSVIKLVGAERAMLSIVLVCACSPTAGSRCSWWSLRSIRLPPRCSARAAFPSA
jgi:TRAP-type C4-dicarboxylate transport system permease large subunit